MFYEAISSCDVKFWNRNLKEQTQLVANGFLHYLLYFKSYKFYFILIPQNLLCLLGQSELIC